MTGFSGASARACIALMVAGVCLLPCRGSGQYVLEAKLDQEAYLQFETVVVRVKIKNVTNRIVVVGGLQSEALLEFDIVNADSGRRVQRRSKGVLVENLLVMAGESKEVGIVLGDHYDIETAGRYDVSAMVAVNDARFVSSRISLTIVPGLVITSVDRPVPDNPSRVRTYSLRYWHRAEREYLFLSVMDRAEGISYGVFNLGPVMRMMRPELIVDITGEILVKHQLNRDWSLHTTLRSTLEKVVMIRQDSVRYEGEGEKTQ